MFFGTFQKTHNKWILLISFLMETGLWLLFFFFYLMSYIMILNFKLSGSWQNFYNESHKLWIPKFFSSSYFIFPHIEKWI